jgi:hypothetical protein
MESIFWSFKNDEAKKKFLDEVGEVIGVDEQYMTYPDHKLHMKNKFAMSSCAGSRPPADGQPPKYEDMTGSCQGEHWWHNAPTIGTGYTVDKVPNPKDIISKTLSGIDIDPVMGEFELAVLADEYDEDSSDLVDALVLPIFMMSSGLEMMDTVVEMGKEIEKNDKIAFIMNLLSAIFLVVGGFGGVAAGASSAALRVMGQAFVLIAETGNLGLGLYTAVGDKTTIPLLIFGLIMSATGLRSAVNVSKAASLRRGMTSQEIANINPRAGTLAGIVKTANTKTPSNLCRYA